MNKYTIDELAYNYGWGGVKKLNIRGQTNEVSNNH